MVACAIHSSHASLNRLPKIRWLTSLLFSFHLCFGYVPVAKDSRPRPSIVLNSVQPLEAGDHNPPVSVGFVGCGTIAKAIATGLATQQSVSIKSIAVSRRSKSKSTSLERHFPNLVSVYDDNQDVLDESDLIFVSVLPQQTSPVLKQLRFDEGRHTLISVVSTSKLGALEACTNLPGCRIHKMICLPSVARQEGVSLLVPPVRDKSFLKQMLESLGGCVECVDEAKMSSLMTPSGMMGPMYGLLRHNRDWLVQRGITKSDASYFIGRLYWGMLQDAERMCRDPDAFDDLIAEQTPGGLNEQALANLEDLGQFRHYDTAMNALLARIEGRSDGSLA